MKAAGIAAALAAATLSFNPRAFAASATVTINAGTVVRTADRRLLVGNNVAAWWDAGKYEDPVVRKSIRDLGPTLIRLPGGSWGDTLWWNGNGVRREGSNDLDRTKFDPKPYSSWSAPYGVWRVDYSGYAPGFMSFKGTNDGWHGNVDVKYLHEWIRGVNSQALAIVNAGQGTPRDAAEWVRWAKKEGYDVRYWEVGNELGGSWEAGNLLPDGTRLNGRIFASRYEEFARAIKAVDPAARIGCMDWVSDVLAHCGDLVDFVSIHTYPVNGSETDAELFGKLDTVRREVEPVRALIQKYQPRRAGSIEIGYTEWNMHLPDTRSALWYAGFIGEMFRQGVSFSTHFQLFDTILPGDPTVRNVNYLSFWLWRHAMGDDLVETGTAEAGGVIVYATRAGNGLSVMLMNADPDREVAVNLRIDGFVPGKAGQILRLSRREHLWLDRRPGARPWEKPRDALWSTGLGMESLPAGKEMTVPMPPASLAVLRLPSRGSGLAKVDIPASPSPAPKEPRLEIWFPSATAYADTPLEGWVLAFNGPDQVPYPKPLPDAVLTVAGPARTERPAVRLAECAGRFMLTAAEPGSVTVMVTASGRTVRKSVAFVPSVPQPRVFWEFEEEKPDYLRSQWTFGTDASIRPNQRVVRVDLGGDNPAKSGKRELLVIQRLPGPDRLAKENIRGAFFDLKVSDDFECRDPGAGITVVMQSPMNWWMVLGRTPLAGLKGLKDWKTVTLMTDKPEHMKAMAEASNVWLILESSKPVKGSVFVDRAGLMVR